MSPGAVCHRADYIAWKGQRWEPVNPIAEVLGWGSTHYLQFDWVQGVLVGVHNWGAGSKRWCDGESGIMLGHTTIHRAVHKGADGNEIADDFARAAAESATRSKFRPFGQNNDHKELNLPARQTRAAISPAARSQDPTRPPVARLLLLATPASDALPALSFSPPRFSLPTKNL